MVVNDIIHYKNVENYKNIAIFTFSKSKSSEMVTSKNDQLDSENISHVDLMNTKKHISSGGNDKTIGSENITNKQMSDAMHLSEKRFRTLYYQSPIAIEHYDKTGCLIDVNPSCLKMFGISNMEDIRNFNLFDDPNLSDNAKHKLRQNEMVQYQGVFDFDKVRKLKLYSTRKTGYIWIDVIITPLKNNEEVLEGYLVQVNDITDRILAVEAIRKSEENYRNLFENVQDVFYKINIKGTIIEISPSIKYLSGYEREELIGRSVIILYANSEDRTNFLNYIKKNIEVRDYELNLKSKTCKTICSSINARMLFDNDGKPNYITGSIRDITKRKMAEAMFHDVIEKNPMSIQIIDKNGFNIKVNPAHTLLFGALPPKDYSVFNDKQLIQSGYTQLFEKLKSGEVVHFPDSYYNAHAIDKSIPDKPMYLRVSGFPINYGEHTPEQFVMLHENITKRKLAEDALRESEEKYRLLFENSSQAIMVAQGDFFRFVNPRACEILGYSEEEVLSIPIPEFIYSEDKDKVIGNYRMRLKGESSPQNYQFRFLRKDKTIKWVELNAVLIEWLGKNATLNFLSDITKRKKAEDELYHSNEQLHQLTNYIEEVREGERLALARELHDELGQALTAVNIDLVMIKKKISNDQIAQKIEKISALVNDTIKSVQRITSNLRPEIINDLGLDEALELYTQEFSERSGIDILLDIDPDLVFHYKTALHIYRIVQESLTNISRHAKATRVVIMFRKNIDSVCIRISDNGIGINEDFIESKQSFGLMSMKERANSLGGTFDIYHGINKGTEIKLILPLQNI